MQSTNKLNRLVFMGCALAALILSGCGRQEPRPQVFSVEGTQAERASEITQILKKYGTPPGVIVDGHWEEHFYDNSYGRVPGPSELYVTGSLVIEHADKPLWRALLETGPRTDLTIENRPRNPPQWFPSEEELGTCEIFHARSIVGRSVGWAALFAHEDRIVFYAFDP